MTSLNTRKVYGTGPELPANCEVPHILRPKTLVLSIGNMAKKTERYTPQKLRLRVNQTDKPLLQPFLPDSFEKSWPKKSQKLLLQSVPSQPPDLLSYVGNGWSSD